MLKVSRIYKLFHILRCTEKLGYEWLWHWFIFYNNISLYFWNGGWFIYVTCFIYVLWFWDCLTRCSFVDFDCFDADDGSGLFSSVRLSQDNPMKVVWKQGFVRLVIVAGILWMLLILIVLLFHVWSCQSSFSFFSGTLDTFFCLSLLLYICMFIFIWI